MTSLHISFDKEPLHIHVIACHLSNESLHRSYVRISKPVLRNNKVDAKDAGSLPEINYCLYLSNVPTVENVSDK